MTDYYSLYVWNIYSLYKCKSIKTQEFRVYRILNDQYFLILSEYKEIKKLKQKKKEIKTIEKKIDRIFFFFETIKFVQKLSGKIIHFNI